MQWNLYAYNEAGEVLLKTHHLPGMVFTKSCLFSLSWKTTCLKRPQNWVVALYRVFWIINTISLASSYYTTFHGEADRNEISRLTNEPCNQGVPCGFLTSTHYNDVTMGAIVSPITSLTIVYSVVYSDADQKQKHQSSASLAVVRGIHRTNGQLRGKCFHLMTSSWHRNFTLGPLPWSASSVRLSSRSSI